VSNLTDNDDDFMAAMERIVGDDDEWGRSPTVTLPREVLKRLVDIAAGRRGGVS
jgi:hypothetical protein